VLSVLVVIAGVWAAGFMGSGAVEDGEVVVQSGGFGGAPSPTESARRSDLIVRGQIVAELDAVWNTSDSRKPELSDREIVKSGYEIFTPYVVRIDETFYGESPSSGEILIKRAGGESEGIRFVSENSTHFNIGDTVVSFLRTCGDERVSRLGSEAFRYLHIAIWPVVGDKVVLGGSYEYPLDEIVEVINVNKGEEPRYTPPDC
jgi:hypothetical protein